MTRPHPPVLVRFAWAFVALLAVVCAAGAASRADARSASRDSTRRIDAELLHVAVLSAAAARHAPAPRARGFDAAPPDVWLASRLAARAVAMVPALLASLDLPAVSAAARRARLMVFLN